MNRCIHEQIQESVHNYIPGQIHVQLHCIYVALSVHSHIFALRLHLELRCSDMRLHCGSHHGCITYAAYLHDMHIRIALLPSIYCVFHSANCACLDCTA